MKVYTSTGITIALATIAAAFALAKALHKGKTSNG